MVGENYWYAAGFCIKRGHPVGEKRQRSIKTRPKVGKYIDPPLMLQTLVFFAIVLVLIRSQGKLIMSVQVIFGQILSSWAACVPPPAAVFDIQA
jgi:hypothetical protein